MVLSSGLIIILVMALFYYIHGLIFVLQKASDRLKYESRLQKLIDDATLVSNKATNRESAEVCDTNSNVT